MTVSSIADTSAWAQMASPCSPLHSNQTGACFPAPRLAQAGISTDIPLPFCACQNLWPLWMSLTPGNIFLHKKAPLSTHTFCWHFPLSAFSLFPLKLRDVCTYVSFTLPLQRHASISQVSSSLPHGKNWTEMDSGISIHSPEHMSPGLTLPLLHLVIGGSLFLILQPSTVSIPIGAECRVWVP